MNKYEDIHVQNIDLFKYLKLCEVILKVIFMNYKLSYVKPYDGK